MKKTILVMFAVVLLACLAVVPTAFAAGPSTTLTVSYSGTGTGVTFDGSVDTGANGAIVGSAGNFTQGDWNVGISNGFGGSSVMSAYNASAFGGESSAYAGVSRSDSLWFSSSSQDSLVGASATWGGVTVGSVTTSYFGGVTQDADATASGKTFSVGTEVNADSQFGFWSESNGISVGVNGEWGMATLSTYNQAGYGDDIGVSAELDGFGYKGQIGMSTEDSIGFLMTWNSGHASADIDYNAS